MTDHLEVKVLSGRLVSPVPGQTLSVDGEAKSTKRGGCVVVPDGCSTVEFACDNSALPSSAYGYVQVRSDKEHMRRSTSGRERGRDDDDSP